jgi:hypothetical protein
VVCAKEALKSSRTYPGLTRTSDWGRNDVGVNGPPHANDSWNYHAKAAELKLLLCVALHTDVGDVGRK